MGRFLPLGILLLPLIEIAGFIVIGGRIGVLATLLWVAGAAVAGVLVIKAKGLSLANQIQSTMGHGQLPGQTVADAMFVFLAGVLLLIPGFFTDFLAILLLLPPVRGLLYTFLRSRMTVVSTASYSEHHQAQVRQEGVIDLDEDDYRPR